MSIFASKIAVQAVEIDYSTANRDSLVIYPMQIKPVTRITPSDRHEMTVLDPELLSQHAAFKAKGRWRGGFNIAAWVRFPEGLIEPAQLMLSYRDGERRKSYLIDRCLPNRQTLILLNGSVDLDVSGEVEEMTLFLKGLSENAVWILDECHIEPKQKMIVQRSQKQRKIPTPSIS